MSRRLNCPSRRLVYLRTAISSSPIFNGVAPFSATFTPVRTSLRQRTLIRRVALSGKPKRAYGMAGSETVCLRSDISQSNWQTTRLQWSAQIQLAQAASLVPPSCDSGGPSEA